MTTLGTEAPSSAPTTPSLAPTGRRTLRSSRRLWLFALPAAVFYTAIMLLPTGQGIVYALTNWDGISKLRFVGFANFTHILDDPSAAKAIVNTVLYATITTLFENAIGLLLALGLHTKIKSRNILRVVFFMPVVILSIVVAYLWQYLLSPSGLATQALRAVGAKDANPLWLNDPNLVVYAICIIVIWQFSGYAMVIYLAGLEGVPDELLEAAYVDGAGRFRRFWYVTRPALAAAFTVNILLSLIHGLMLFDQIWATTGGGPDDASQSLSTIVYRTAFQYGQLGPGLALAMVLGLGVAVVGFVQYRFLGQTRGGR